MNKKLQKQLKKIIPAAILFAAGFLPLPQLWQLSLFTASYLLVGTDIIFQALRNFRHGRIFDENFLMTLATFGAFALGEYSEAVAVMLFFQIGEFFQSYAVNRSRQSITELMNIRPDYANVRRGKEILTVSPEEVKTGETIVIRPGERIPLDGIVTKGSSALDTAALTGESLPREVAAGAEVLSGCINLTGVLEVKTTAEFAASTVSQILELVENASSQKAGIENFITRFARCYTPVVVIIAAFLAVIPPLLSGSMDFRDWGYRAITFLVISCPCALVISIPLSFFGGLGAASRCGILIKGSNYLEALAETGTVVFDKTGTLTQGLFKVIQINPQGISKTELLQLAAHAEAHSSHPIAVSVREAWGRQPDRSIVSDVKEFSGHGITARIGKDEVAAGNFEFIKSLGIAAREDHTPGTAVYLAVNKKFAGSIIIADEVRPDAQTAIAALKAEGVKQTVMLTGDRSGIAAEIAKETGIDKYFANLLPAGKVQKIEELMTALNNHGKIIFVGDGINDAPVLARSDIGIAMGGIGSDAAIEAADIVIMTDEPSKIAPAIRIARKTLHIAKENIVFALGVKFLVLALGAAGYASIWAAVFADVGVSVIAVLNAARTLRLHKNC
ncbi:MAG: heavy metal translocating P-type ATPase [Alphaproteobacteria bacterium]|nr:heavy metal translocating P-type ATPase [Alphaproteobacteria bacterium]